MGGKEPQSCCGSVENVEGQGAYAIARIASIVEVQAVLASSVV
jgi:hypothetical protein